MSIIGLLFAAFLLWAAQGILYKHLWDTGLTASVTFCQDSATEGECAALTETVTNAKYLPLPALHVNFQMGRDLVFLKQENSSITDQNYRSDIFSCLPWQQISRRLEFCCQKRGLYAIRQVDLISYDLLWSSRFLLSLPADTSMYVYPSFVDPVRLTLPMRQLTGALAARQSLQRDPFELQSIRSYTQGDPYRDINWKATARTGDLKVNVHAPASFWQVMLLLDGDSDRLWEDQELREESVRLGATLAERLHARKIPVSIRTNGRDCLTREEPDLLAGAGASHLRSILELLARIDFTIPGRRPMETIIEELLCPTGGRTGNGSRSCHLDSTLFILVSPCQKASLADAFARLCERSPGSQWILPLRPGDEIRVDLFRHPFPVHLYPWEVSYANKNRCSLTPTDPESLDRPQP